MVVLEPENQWYLEKAKLKWIKKIKLMIPELLRYRVICIVTIRCDEVVKEIIKLN